MRGSDCNQAHGGEKESQGVGRVRVGQGDRPVGSAECVAEGGKGEDFAVCGQETIREAAENIEGGVPGGPDPECVEKGTHGGRVGYRRKRPRESVHREW